MLLYQLLFVSSHDHKFSVFQELVHRTGLKLDLLAVYHGQEWPTVEHEQYEIATTGGEHDTTSLAMEHSLQPSKLLMAEVSTCSSMRTMLARTLQCQAHQSSCLYSTLKIIMHKQAQ